MVLCLGQFFTASDSCNVEWKECLDGNIQSPVPLFILGPMLADQEEFYSHVLIDDGGELCQNITYLGITFATGHFAFNLTRQAILYTI